MTELKLTLIILVIIVSAAVVGALLGQLSRGQAHFIWFRLDWVSAFPLA
ncbi:UNVERIFIED_ORG: hypothetical protein ABIB19_003498 [Arthrobacter sp. UYEF10]